jgi:hypothetical protein
LVVALSGAGLGIGGMTAAAHANINCTIIGSAGQLCAGTVPTNAVVDFITPNGNTYGAGIFCTRIGASSSYELAYAVGGPAVITKPVAAPVAGCPIP